MIYLAMTCRSASTCALAAIEEWNPSPGDHSGYCLETRSQESRAT